ncbi:50S ribosomal protein L32 [Austwickia sp. TVS 96-490-7B]|uniref:50S ribosomal protein L32 n=1 Tax=Austwickia sp. TVS 96-490-7B TaxID=2830843 RepID=UPI001C55C880|nr:50S ribosomal protein L32 [Austwickia sp. TVS 96-490-7B]MBW3084702.1 50S ribosomal protein L32 [Austwickia sp. TVS 96-490-7B]
MAVPKRKMSRSNTRSRRANWKAQAPDLVSVVVDGQECQVPRRLVRAVQKGLVDPLTVGL